MSRRYRFADIDTPEKPRIVPMTRQFGDRVYSYRCTGRGSEGWGTTPADAFTAWSRNWRRRVKFYGYQAGQFARVDELLA